MQSLDPINRRVANISGGKALKPVVFNFSVRLTHELTQAHARGNEALKHRLGLFE